VNGTNTVFTTFRSYVGGSIEVYINGVRQKNGVHFTETTPGSGIFTMSDAPLTGDDIGVSYQYAASASFNADTVDGYHAFDLMPVGAGMDFWGSTLPSGNWLFAYGQAISRATYAQLFALLGTTYGVGDGSTTFNLPDKRGRVTAGKDDMGGTSANRLTNQSGGLDGDVLGANGGNEVHTLTRAQMPNINGTFTMHGAGAGGSTVLASVSGDFTDTGVSGQYRPGGSNTAGANSLYGASLNVGGNGAHNNVQPTLIANYIIKVL
jgi:microcystin-dependent protein